MRPTSYRKYTDEEINYIKAHCNETPKDVAAVIGAPCNTVRVYMQRFRSGGYTRHPYPPKMYYALYLRKTDELVCSGSAKDCAEQMGIGVRAFYVLVNKAIHGKTKKWDVYTESYKEAFE